MKKLLTIVLALMVGFGTVVVADSSNLSEKEIKEIKKDAEKSAKKRVKEFKKQKWEYNGTSDLETKVLAFLLLRYTASRSSSPASRPTSRSAPARSVLLSSTMSAISQ